jgi:hypothetical protein
MPRARTVYLSRSLEHASNPCAHVHLQLSRKLSLFAWDVEVPAFQASQHPALNIGGIEFINAKPRPHDAVANEALCQRGSCRAGTVVLGVEPCIAIRTNTPDLKTAPGPAAVLCPASLLSANKYTAQQFGRSNGGRCGAGSRSTVIGHGHPGTSAAVAASENSETRTSRSINTDSVSRMSCRPTAYGQQQEADRLEVQPPIEVEASTWTAAGTFDYWVKEEQEWWGRVREPDGHQIWIRASDLRRSTAFNQ